MQDSSIAGGFTTGFGSAFLQFLFERFALFGSLAWKEIITIWDVENELHKLQRTLLKIQELLDRTGTRGFKFSYGGKAWKMWHEDLTRLAYDADALLDRISFITSDDRTKSWVDAGCSKQEVRSKILSSFKFNLPREISNTQKKLEEFAKEMKSLMLIENLGSWDFGNSSLVTKTSSFVDEGAIVGRLSDKEKVLGLLNNTDDDVAVISLVGMGGIGKTTLAQLLYNDPEVRETFQLRIWVSVSIELDLMKITRGIIESATRQPCTLSNLDSLQLKLKEVLARRGKFLIVLDDYWSEIIDEWNVLFAPLRSGWKGSRVIVTTRSVIVSKIVGSVGKAHTLRELSVDDCWSLIREKAIITHEEMLNLESIGNEIAKKCKGLPLAAKTIGYVLHLESTRKDKWQTILECQLWDFPQNQNGIFPSLMLSYLHLPAHLQRCFAYCSIFPRGHAFQAEELVLLWMAEGFIQPMGGRKPEDIGKDYFNDLYMRCFFVLEEDSSTIYRIHDLVHDLARLISSGICVQVKHDTSPRYPLFGNACHLSLHHETLKLSELKASSKNKRLRTFVVTCNTIVPDEGKIDENIFFNSKFMRVLDLRKIGLKELPDAIEHLIYLRYLNLSGNTIQCLPQTISKLLALQTIKLLDNAELNAWPDEMKSLKNLRHLHFDVDGKLTRAPSNLRDFVNLQTLSAFFVTKRAGEGIEELENMDSLRGSLSIVNLDDVNNHTDAKNAKLENKSYLDALSLVWTQANLEIAEQPLVLENLRPHKDLKELVIKNYSGMRCPNWMSDQSQKLTKIRLEGLCYCRDLPSLGKLPFLKSLYIGGMLNLPTIDHNFYGAGSCIKFKSLESLELHQMGVLEQWTDQSNNVSMPNLMSFVLDDCPILATLPSNLQSFSSPSISGCPRLPDYLPPPP